MKLEELQNALATSNALSIEGGRVRVGPNSLDKTFPARILAPFYEKGGIEFAEAKVQGGDSSPRKVVIMGKASFPSLNDSPGGPARPLLDGTTEVLATFELTGNQEMLGVTLRYDLRNLPKPWRFLQSFSELPIRFDYESERYDYESNQSALDSTFALTDCYFYLTTHKHKLKDDSYGQVDDGDVFLEEGLNVIGRWTPSGMLGLIAHLTSGHGRPRVLQGKVIPSSTSTLPTLEGEKLPWDVSRRIPGIYLSVPLGSGPSFPPGSKAIQFTELRVESYSPLSKNRLLDSPSYEPAMAYLGDVVIPAVRSTKLLTISARISLGQEDQLVFACQFVECTLDNLLKSVEVITGGGDWYSGLPKPLRDVMGKLGPESASITLTRPSRESSYEVGCTEFTIGTGGKADPWSLFAPADAPEDGLIKISFESVRVAVVKPFGGEQRSILGTIKGTAEFFKVKFDVRVEAPSLYFSAEQVGTTTFSLRGYFGNNMPWPKFLPDEVTLADMKLEADPNSFYSFSMSLGGEYDVNDKKLPTPGYSWPTIRLAVSYRIGGDKPYWVWQFKAGTDSGKGVPVFLLIKKLASDVGIDIPMPTAIKGLTIDSVALSYDSGAEHFAFECWGTLPLNGVDLECCFTIDTKSKSAETNFGGQILLRLGGRKPLSFSLMFGKSENSKYCLATYHDAYGYELKIQSLVHAVSPDLAQLIPPSLSMTLKSAFLAYYSKSAPETVPANGSEAKPAFLFGVDLGAKVKLSDLPIIGSVMPKDQAIGFESLRIILASADVEQASVGSLDQLLEKTGVKPLLGASGSGDGKGGLKEGCNVTAELLFGSLSSTLSLPLAGGIKDSPKEPAVVEKTGGGEVAAPSKADGTGSLAKTEKTDSVAKTEDATKWFEIGKSLGPVSVQRVGLGYAEGRVGIKFDASLQLGVMTFTLDGLGMTYPVDKFTQPSQFLKHVKFTLDGMGLALGNGPIEIGGSLVRVPLLPASTLRLHLEGTLLIRTAAFSFSAFGSYTEMQDKTVSLMAFGVLLAELGDPTGTGAFLVTGLAFGFGVNRTLILPTIEEVQNFPLVKAAMGGDSFTERKALPQQLRDYVLPAAGNFWLAAGIKFNSFGMVDSFLLVSVSWGAEIEIGLLGLSRMSAPTRVQPKDTIACAELALRGVIRIAEGLIQFEARLTENSYIFSTDCRLTGGFAFCVWFKGPHAGDFVISLGGYHPAFQRPAHYPLVPRVGMLLQIGTELSITGEAYFALTPSCIMAGGKLCAVYKSGGIEAWFIAYADFLMSWQPFYYQAAIGITLGIALRLGAIAIRLELSVDLKLQGPPFGGEARVQLWIISFTIPFGEPASAPKPLTAGEFIERCLPAPRSLPSAQTSSQVPLQPDVLSVRITGGLLREQEIEETTGKRVTEATKKGTQKRTYRIVNAHQLSLTVQSVIPWTKFEGLAKDLATASPCGIRPMGMRSLHSVFKVEFLRADGGKHEKLHVSAITGNVADALWGKCAVEKEVPLPEKPENKTVPATVGIRIACTPLEPAFSLPVMPAATLKEQDYVMTVPRENPGNLPKTIGAGGKKFFETIWADTTVTKRKAILGCLQARSPDLVLNEPKLERISRMEKNYFQHQPAINAVGYPCE